MLLRIRTATLLVASSLVLASACGPVSGPAQGAAALPPVPDVASITAEGRLEPIRFTNVAASTEGLIGEVLVKEGDPVSAGQVLARLQDPLARTLDAAQADASQELSQASQDVRDAQNALDAYPVPRIFVGLTAEEVARIWLERLQTARADFQPYKDMSRKHWKRNQRIADIPIFPGLPRTFLFDTNEYHDMALEYKKHLDIAWVNYRKACAWLALESNLESGKARLLDAQRRTTQLQDALFSEDSAGVRATFAGAEIRAPLTGTITNLDMRPGDFAEAGKVVATVADLSGWVVKTTNLTEIDVVNVREGQAVTITLDALPGVALQGRVISIAKNFGLRQGDIVYPVTISLKSQALAMRWGLTAQVTFQK
jgi:multidrug resistance efflux pump